MTSCEPRKRAGWSPPSAWWAVFLSGVVITAGSRAAAGWAAETADPADIGNTSLSLKVERPVAIPVRASAGEDRTVITLEFPRGEVTASLPERSVLDRGVIRAVAVRYESGSAGVRRFVQAIDIILTAPYPFQVRSEPGRILVDIRHPMSIGATAVEVGLTGGTIIEGFGKGLATGRFRAMQEALTHAMPRPWSLEVAPAPPGGASGDAVGATGAMSAGAVGMARGGPSVRSPSAQTAAAGPAEARRVLLTWVALLLGLALGAAVGVSMAVGRRPGTFSRPSAAKLPSGVVLMEQLVWRAFERQGYQLVAEIGLSGPLLGTMRVIAKDGAKAALLFVGNGPFFEKQTVEDFWRAMREAKIEQGFLVASGSFTVPAQRTAHEQRIRLIAREQLIELLSEGAGSEHFARQLEQQQARVAEAKDTLAQYASELDDLRRQRNEASWHLGEERAKSAGLEQQLAQAAERWQRAEAELGRWEEEAAALRKRWEESEWYLGESREQARHAQAQLAAAQETVARLEAAEGERDETRSLLHEARARLEVRATQLADLEREFREAAARETALQDQLRALQGELEALRVRSERRRSPRAAVPGLTIELFKPGAEEPVYAGPPRDISGRGFGCEMGEELAAGTRLRARLRLPSQAAIESSARLRWQRASGDPTRYQSGYRLTTLPVPVRQQIHDLVEQSRASVR